MNFSYLINLKEKTVEYILLENLVGTTSWRIGRNSESDIILRDLRASRNHALLLKAKEKYYLLDLNSKNGTFLNQKKVKQKVRLKSGDCIKIGRTELEFSSFENWEIDSNSQIPSKISEIVKLAARFSNDTKESIFVKDLLERNKNIKSHKNLIAAKSRKILMLK